MTSGDGSHSRFRGRFATRHLRRASFISPLTGERSAVPYTLRDASTRANGTAHAPAEDTDGHPHESTPLLPRPGGHAREGYWASKAADAKSWTILQAQHAYKFATSKTGLNILKCSIAYLLGSMATFVPAIRQLVGYNQASKHMVATVTVWFHPARTLGSMHEATVLAFIALVYSGFISFTSMGISMFFENHDLLLVGHAIILIVFVGGGLGFVAWVKLRLNHPLVNVAAALASLSCITVLIKEGAVQAGVFSYERPVQVLTMVMLGILTTTAVNMVVLPVTARNALNEDLEKTTDLLGEMLISITRAFLSGREADMLDESYQSLSEEHSAALETMKKDLGEAKREYYIVGGEKLWDVHARIVDCLSGLSQDIGGLRSAALIQFAIINEDAASDDSNRSPEFRTPSPVLEQAKLSKPLDSIAESPEDIDYDPDEAYQSTSTLNQEQPLSPGAGRIRDGSVESTAGALNSSEDMFLAFINHLGPPTKSLVYTLKQILDELPFKIGRSPQTTWKNWIRNPPPKVAVNENFHSSLEQAVDLYRRSRRDALEGLYKNRAISIALAPPKNERPTMTRRCSGQVTPGERLVADVEEVSACVGHFSFSLLDFAEDVLTFLDLLDELKLQMENPTWSWCFLIPSFRGPHEQPKIVRSGANFSRASTFNSRDEENDLSYAIPVSIRKADAFGDPKRAAQKRPWTYPLYRIQRVFRRDDVKFALKVGVGAMLFSLPAFLPETRHIFVQWRGEWGMVSYMAICSMTVGASNTTGINRIIGTLIGALTAIVAWITSNSRGVANPYLLAAWGWIVSLFCFYLMLVRNNGPMARFILLTYNLGALYSFSLAIHDRNDDDDQGGIDPAIWSIMLHRVVAVIAGVTWGIIITRFISPISARKKLTNGLCTLWLRMSLIWKRDPLALFLLGEPRSRYMDIREEAALQAFLTNLNGLRQAAVSEFELRGPFPDGEIKRILEKTGRMLDAFHAMNVVISKTSRCTRGEAAVLRATRPERFELSARISHLFSVLASSLKLEYPLHDVFPSIDGIRDRLLATISEFRRAGEGRELVTDQDYEMLYAYVLVTGQLSQEIESVSSEIESLYGTLNEDNLKLE